MRILLVIDFHPRYPGGMEQHVRALSHHLALRGHDVAVAAAAGAAPGAERSEPAVPIYPLTGFSRILPFLNRDPDRPFPLPVWDPLVYRGLQRLIDRFRPDVIHAHGWSIFTALHLELPVVATLHDYGLFCPKRTLLRPDGICDEGPGLSCVECGRGQYGLAKSAAVSGATWLGKSSLPKVCTHIAVSRSVREAYLRFTAIPPDQVVVIPNFYGGEDRMRPQESGDVQLPSEYILYLGNLARYKGVHVLLEAYRRLDTEVPLVMMGYPIEDIRENEPNVHILRGASHALAMQAMARCLFAVVPSIWSEPFGIVALEAMSQGKAVVASAIGGLTDIVDPGETGLLVQPGDPAALAAAMAELLDNFSLRERLGEMGRRRLDEQFSPGVVVPRIEAVYHQVCGGRFESSALSRPA